jgi:hypothetical protein
MAITSKLSSTKYTMGKCKTVFHQKHMNKGNNKITELRTILQRESQNS